MDHLLNNLKQSKLFQRALKLGAAYIALELILAIVAITYVFTGL